MKAKIQTLNYKKNSTIKVAIINKIIALKILQTPKSELTRPKKGCFINGKDKKCKAAIIILKI